jgi:hypothetical protein
MGLMKAVTFSISQLLFSAPPCAQTLRIQGIVTFTNTVTTTIASLTDKIIPD